MLFIPACIVNGKASDLISLTISVQAGDLETKYKKTSASFPVLTYDLQTALIFRGQDSSSQVEIHSFLNIKSFAHRQTCIINT